MWKLFCYSSVFTLQNCVAKSLSDRGHALTKVFGCFFSLPFLKRLVLSFISVWCKNHAIDNTFLICICILFLFGRVTVTSKRLDNILLKRPPVLRVSSTQEGLSDLTSDTLVRSKNPSDAMASESRLSFSFLLQTVF